jgi:hypothetical protein
MAGQLAEQEEMAMEHGTPEPPEEPESPTSETEDDASDPSAVEAKLWRRQ